MIQICLDRMRYDWIVSDRIRYGIGQAQLGVKNVSRETYWKWGRDRIGIGQGVVSGDWWGFGGVLLGRNKSQFRNVCAMAFAHVNARPRQIYSIVCKPIIVQPLMFNSWLYTSKQIPRIKIEQHDSPYCVNPQTLNLFY